jgi:hypothetical protein
MDSSRSKQLDDRRRVVVEVGRAEGRQQCRHRAGLSQNPLPSSAPVRAGNILTPPHYRGPLASVNQPVCGAAFRCQGKITPSQDPHRCGIKGMQDRHGMESIAVIRPKHACSNGSWRCTKSCRVMLADRWVRLLAGVKRVECAQTRRFQRDACDQP